MVQIVTRDRWVLPILFVLALLPRLPFVLVTAGNDISQCLVTAGATWLRSGHYTTCRPPGAPSYELTVGLLDLLWPPAEGQPYFYRTNLLSVVATFFTLYVLLLIYRRFLSPARSFWAVVFFNFHPHELIMGGATTDMNFLLLFGVISVSLFLSARIYSAILVSCLGSLARIQGLALTIPLCLILLFRDYASSAWRRFALDIAMCALVGLLIFLPGLYAFGLASLEQPYHRGEFTARQEMGAFVLRTLNLFGVAGGPLLVGAALWGLATRRMPAPTATTFLGIATVALTLVFFFKAPWEAFYLLPLVPFAYFVAFRPGTFSRTALALFLASCLLSGAVQIQLRPWRFPPFVVRDGIFDAQWNEAWIVRGGG